MAIFTLHTDFALISRVFIRWSCNFTWMSTMHIQMFCILLTNLWKCLVFSEIILGFTLKQNKYFFKAFFLKFTCFFIKNLGGKIGRKIAILYSYYLYALITTVLIRWSCNFIWISTMHITKFRISLTHLWKLLERILFSSKWIK